MAIRNVSEATGNLKRMLSPRVVSPGPEMFADTPEAEQKRREFGEAYTELMKREWFSIGIHLGYVFEGSPIVIPDGTPRPEDTVQTYTPTARPGSRAPHVWLEPGRSILDLFGKEFVLLRFGEDAPSGDGLATEAAARGVPFRVVTIDNAEAAALYERRLVLVRPDGQVVWRDDNAPARPGEIIDAVRGIADGQALGIRSAA